MAVNREYVELIVSAKGQGAVTDLDSAIKLTDGSIQALNHSFAAGNVSLNNYKREVIDLSSRKKQLAEDLQAVNVQLGNFRGLTALTSSQISGMGQATLTTGRIVQDFAQGGLPGIINNFEAMGTSIAKVAKLTPALGAAIGGVASIVGTAALVIVSNWKSIKQGLEAVGILEPVKGFEDGVKSLQDRIKELEKKPIRIAVEQEELTRLNDQLREALANKSALDRLLGKQTPQEEAASKAFEAATVNAPGGVKDVQRRLVNNVAADIGQHDQGLAKARAELEQRDKEREQGLKNLGPNDLFERGRLDSNRQAAVDALRTEQARVKQEAEQYVNAPVNEKTGKGGILALAARGKPGAAKEVADRLAKAGADKATVTNVRLANPDDAYTEEDQKADEDVAKKWIEDTDKAVKARKKAFDDRIKEREKLIKGRIKRATDDFVDGLKDQNKAAEKARKKAEADAKKVKKDAEKDHKDVERITEQQRTKFEEAATKAGADATNVNGRVVVPEIAIDQLFLGNLQRQNPLAGGRRVDPKQAQKLNEAVEKRARQIAYTLLRRNGLSKEKAGQLAPILVQQRQDRINAEIKQREEETGGNFDQASAQLLFQFQAGQEDLGEHRGEVNQQNRQIQARVNAAQRAQAKNQKQQQAAAKKRQQADKGNRSVGLGPEPQVSTEELGNALQEVPDTIDRTLHLAAGHSQAMVEFLQRLAVSDRRVSVLEDQLRGILSNNRAETRTNLNRIQI